MQTIDTLTAIAAVTNHRTCPNVLKIGTFELSNYIPFILLKTDKMKFRFQMHLMRHHLQPLKQAGFTLFFHTKKPIQTGNSNDLYIEAEAPISVLMAANEWARPNHVNHFSMEIMHAWQKQRANEADVNDFKEHQQKIEAIHKQARRLFSEKKIKTIPSGWTKKL